MKPDYNINSKIYFDFKSFKPVLEKWKADNEKIVFTNGCFDLIHYGHIDNLIKSANLGTKLIIGLNSDESVEKLKGKGRPIMNLKTRSSLLAAFAFVDAVIIFSEDTPEGLIAEILPDYLAKGNEYAINEIVGHEIVLRYGGQVKALEIVPDISTTDIIKKIKSID
jgi:D-glycero-beta-D-manno-heptose 1-phosphate adenylyltransferase